MLIIPLRPLLVFLSIQKLVSAVTIIWNPREGSLRDPRVLGMAMVCGNLEAPALLFWQVVPLGLSGNLSLIHTGTKFCKEVVCGMGTARGFGEKFYAQPGIL